MKKLEYNIIYFPPKYIHLQYIYTSVITHKLTVKPLPSWNHKPKAAKPDKMMINNEYVVE
jgi:hypothetical protein